MNEKNITVGCKAVRAATKAGIVKQSQWSMCIM